MIIPAPAGFRDWGTIRCPEPPPCRFHFDDMLATARAMLASRERQYPKLVDMREMTAEDADAHIATFRGLVDHLQWVCATMTGEDCGHPPITPRLRHDICNELDKSIDTISAICREQKYATLPDDLNDQAHAVIAMRWNYDRAQGPLDSGFAMHRNALINHEIRQRQSRSTAKEAA